MPHRFKTHLIGWLLAIISVTAFASTFIVGAQLTQHENVSPEILACLRFVIAGGILFTLECRDAKHRQQLFQAPTKRDWLLFCTLGPIGTSIMAWCVFKGCALVSTANASMADALTPLMIFCFSALWTRHVTIRQIIGVMCGFIGALCVIKIISPTGIALSAYSIGDVYIMLAAATWALYSVFGRSTIKRIGAGPYTTWTMLIGALFIAVILPFVSSAWPTTSTGWWLVVVLGCISTLLPFWTWNAAQKYLPISTLAVSAYFTPVIAVLLAFLFLDQHTTLLQNIGTLLVCASALVESKS